MVSGLHWENFTPGLEVVYHGKEFTNSIKVPDKINEVHTLEIIPYYFTCFGSTTNDVTVLEEGKSVICDGLLKFWKFLYKKCDIGRGGS